MDSTFIHSHSVQPAWPKPSRHPTPSQRGRNHFQPCGCVGIPDTDVQTWGKRVCLQITACFGRHWDTTARERPAKTIWTLRGTWSGSVQGIQTCHYMPAMYRLHKKIPSTVCLTHNTGGVDMHWSHTPSSIGHSIEGDLHLCSMYYIYKAFYTWCTSENCVNMVLDCLGVSRKKSSETVCWQSDTEGVRCYIEEDR